MNTEVLTPEAPTPEDIHLDALLANERIAGLDKTKWPCNLLRIVEVLSAMWERMGIDAVEATTRAKDATIALGFYMGGAQLYIPTGEDLHKAVRDAVIFQSYRNIPFDADAVAKAHRITPDRARAIYKRQRRLYLEKAWADRGA